jgi:hypothetical protein
LNTVTLPLALAELHRLAVVADVNDDQFGLGDQFQIAGLGFDDDTAVLGRVVLCGECGQGERGRDQERSE